MRKVQNLNEWLDAKNQINEAAKVTFSEDDINQTYGFWGTLEDDDHNAKDYFYKAIEGLMKSYKLTDLEALKVLNSKMGRKAADQIIDGQAKSGVEGLEQYYRSSLKKEMDKVIAMDESAEVNEDWGSSDQSAMNKSIHRDAGNPKAMPSPFDKKLRDAAENAVDFYWEDWEEYQDDRDGLIDDAVRSYLKAYFPKEWQAMVRMFESIDEARDINDPVLMAFRAAAAKRKAEMAKPKRKPLYGKARQKAEDDLWYISQELKDLYSDRGQMLIDMEQEAEVEGGQIADEYGDRLNKIEDEIQALIAKRNTLELRLAESLVNELDTATYRSALKKGKNRGDSKGKDIAINALNLLAKKAAQTLAGQSFDVAGSSNNVTKGISRNNMYSYINQALMTFTGTGELYNTQDIDIVGSDEVHFLMGVEFQLPDNQGGWSGPVKFKGYSKGKFPAKIQFSIKQGKFWVWFGPSETELQFTRSGARAIAKLADMVAKELELQTSIKHNSIKQFDAMKPTNESVDEAKSNVKSVTKKEWDKAHKDYKTEINGQKYMMEYDDARDMTVLVPVEINESNELDEARRGRKPGSGRSINAIQKEWNEVSTEMKEVVKDWKSAEGSDKESYLEKLKTLTAKKKELEKELNKAVKGKDRNVELAATDEALMLEGGMSEIDIMAKTAKNFKAFAKEVMAQFKLEDSKELQAWLHSLYAPYESLEVSEGKHEIASIIDVLSNSMEDMDETEFADFMSGEFGWDQDLSIEVFNSYWDLGAKDRMHWSDKEWTKWLNKHGIK